MKVVIAGSRHLDDTALVDKAIALSGMENQIAEVVCGGAFGVDTSGALWAMSHDVPIVTFNADWGKHGRAAGAIRNGEMADYSDMAIIIWDGKSHGTANMIEQMRKRGKPTFVAIDGIGIWVNDPRRPQEDNDETSHVQLSLL